MPFNNSYYLFILFYYNSKIFKLIIIQVIFVFDEFVMICLFANIMILILTFIHKFKALNP